MDKASDFFMYDHPTKIAGSSSTTIKMYPATPKFNVTIIYLLYGFYEYLKKCPVREKYDNFTHWNNKL